MSRRAISVFAAGLFLVCASLSGAAPIPKAPGGDDSVPPTAAKLLKHRKVQKELKMTAEQRIGLIDGLQDIEENYEKQIDKLVRTPNVPDDAFDKLDKDRLKAAEKLVAETAEKALNATQRTRLRQLDYQLRGPGAFTDARVQKTLQLTDAQKKLAEEFTERMQNMADRYIDEFGGDGEEKIKTELLEFRKEGLTKFTGGLTADQKAIWKDLLGEAVKSFDADELWLRVIVEEDE